MVLLPAPEMPVNQRTTDEGPWRASREERGMGKGSQNKGGDRSGGFSIKKLDSADVVLPGRIIPAAIVTLVAGSMSTKLPVSLLRR